MIDIAKKTNFKFFFVDSGHSVYTSWLFKPCLVWLVGVVDTTDVNVTKMFVILISTLHIRDRKGWAFIISPWYLAFEIMEMDGNKLNLHH